MTDLESFSEWIKRKGGHKPASVKNPNIDSFIKAVDSLKRDMDELDSLEKNPKSKKPESKKPEKEKEKPKDVRKKVDPIEDEEDDFVDDDDVLDDVDVDRDGEPVRLPPDSKVSRDSERIRRKPNRSDDFGDERLERGEFYTP